MKPWLCVVVSCPLRNTRSDLRSYMYTLEILHEHVPPRHYRYLNPSIPCLTCKESERRLHTSSLCSVLGPARFRFCKQPNSEFNKRFWRQAAGGRRSTGSSKCADACTAEIYLLLPPLLPRAATDCSFSHEKKRRPARPATVGGAGTVVWTMPWLTPLQRLRNHTCTRARL